PRLRTDRHYGIWTASSIDGQVLFNRSIGCGICHFKRWTSPSIYVAREPTAHVGPYPTFSVV
ncbi:MAG TPA: hypothetical protein VIS99_07665, partial [Terrimicrobiaceae bacterium]